MSDAMIPLGRFRRQVQQHDPVDLLLKCAAASQYMDENNLPILEQQFTDTVGGFLRTRQALVTHHGLAAVARLAIRDYPWAKSKASSAEDVVALANNWNSVEDPFLGSGIMTLVRVAYEQFPYQEQLADLIPRYLLIFTETKPSNPSLDVPASFQSQTGLTIEEFMKIGVGFYSGAIQGASFTRDWLEGTQAEKLK